MVCSEISCGETETREHVVSQIYYGYDETAKKNGFVVMKLRIYLCAMHLEMILREGEQISMEFE